jgi:hypothetical protein
MVHDIEREATKPLHRDAIAAEVLTRKGWAHDPDKGWAHDPDLLDTVADKVKDVRKRTVSCSEASLEPIGSQKL